MYLCTVKSVQMINDKSTVLETISHKMTELKTPTDYENFFRAFFTPKECATLCDRYQLVEMLLQGTPQREISQALNVSVSQISRGSAELQFGAGKEFFPKFYPEIKH